MAARAMARRGRTAVLWGLAVFVGAQLALAVVIERWQPSWSDPSYGYRVQRLQRQLAREPHRPLLLMLGTSRTGFGFQADLVHPAPTTGPNAVLVTNLGKEGGNCVQQLIMLKRLLARGIRPRWVVFEVLDVCLSSDEKWLTGEKYLLPHTLFWDDLAVLRQHAAAGVARDYYAAWLQWHALPWYYDRYCLVGRYAPAWLRDESHESSRIRAMRHSLSPFGWLPGPRANVSAAEYRAGVEEARHQYAARYAHFRLSPKVDGILRETLDLCRQEGITVLGLVIMPQGSEFRSWIPPATQAEIRTYLNGLCRDYDTELIDASTWLSDDCFFDGHHLLQDGARRFTLRLWREALRPQLEGRRLTEQAVARQAD